MIGRVGLASVMPTLTVSANSNLRPEQLSQSSGAINFNRQLGGALGINLISMGLEQRTAFFADAFAGLQTPDNNSTQLLMMKFGHFLGRLGWPFEKKPAGALYLVGRSIYAQASMMAFSDVFMLIGVVYVRTMTPVLLLRDPVTKPRPRPRLRPRPG